MPKIFTPRQVVAALMTINSYTGLCLYTLVRRILNSVSDASCCMIELLLITVLVFYSLLLPYTITEMFLPRGSSFKASLLRIEVVCKSPVTASGFGHWVTHQNLIQRYYIQPANFYTCYFIYYRGI
jgi:hypothetical protein